MASTTAISPRQLVYYESKYSATLQLRPIRMTHVEQLRFASMIEHIWSVVKHLHLVGYSCFLM